MAPNHQEHLRTASRTSDGEVRNLKWGGWGRRQHLVEGDTCRATEESVKRKSQFRAPGLTVSEPLYTTLSLNILFLEWCILPHTYFFPKCVESQISHDLLPTRQSWRHRAEQSWLALDRVGGNLALPYKATKQTREELPRVLSFWIIFMYFK